MADYLVFLAVLLAASVDASQPPSVSKHYRSDYQYNERTDAFYKLHIEARWRNNVDAVCEVEGASLMAPLNHEDVARAHGMFKQYPDLGKYLWVASDGRDHESAEEPALINLQSSDEKAWQDVYSTRNRAKLRAFTPLDEHECDVMTRDGELKNEFHHCYLKLPFICKVEAKDAPYDPHCDVFAKDYHYNATVGSCYSIRRWVATWNEAYDECHEEGAHLVILNSEAERVAVHALMLATPRVMGGRHLWYYFAGFRAAKPVGNKPVIHRTVFNQTLLEAGYAGWRHGEPKYYNERNCGTLYASDGMLSDANCNFPHAFICEKEIYVQI